MAHIEAYPHFDEEVAAGAASDDPAVDEALRLACTHEFMRGVVSNAIASVIQRSESALDEHAIDKTVDRQIATPSTEPPSRAESALRAESGTPSKDQPSRPESGFRAESSLSFVQRAGPLPEEVEEEEQEKKLEAEQEAVASKEAVARETKSREAQLWAQLCAKQFISEIVLGAILRMPTMVAPMPAAQPAMVAPAPPAPAVTAAPADSVVQTAESVPPAEAVVDVTKGGAQPSAMEALVDVDAIMARAAEQEEIVDSSAKALTTDQAPSAQNGEEPANVEQNQEAPEPAPAPPKSVPIKGPAAKAKSSRVTVKKNEEQESSNGSRRGSKRGDPKVRASVPASVANDPKKRNTTPAGPGAQGKRPKARASEKAVASPKRGLRNDKSLTVAEEDENKEEVEEPLMPPQSEGFDMTGTEMEEGVIEGGRMPMEGVPEDQVLQEAWEEEDQYATEATDIMGAEAYYPEDQFSSGDQAMQFDHDMYPQYYAAPMPAWTTPRTPMPPGEGEYALEIDHSQLAALLGTPGMSVDFGGLAFDAGSAGFIQAHTDTESYSQFYPGVPYEVAEPAEGAYDEQYAQWMQQQYQYQQQYMQGYSEEQLQYMQQQQQQQQQGEYVEEYDYDYDQQGEYLEEEYLQQKEDQQHDEYQKQVSEGTDGTLMKRLETPDGSEKAKDDKSNVDASELRRAVTQRRRLGPKARQKKKTEDNDLFLVTMDTGSAGDASRSSHHHHHHHHSHHDMVEGEEGEMELNQYQDGDAHADYPMQHDAVASGPQLKSVRLLRELRTDRTESKVPSHNPDVDRAKAMVGRGPIYEPPGGIVPASSPVLRKPQDSPTKSPRRVRVKPKAPDDWDWSFTSKAEQRIPVYDSLLDTNCTHLNHPEKLRHIVRARQLPNQYLHVVRARFEQYRSLHRPNDTVGRRIPVLPGPVNDPSATLIPSKLQERAGNVSPGLELQVPPNQRGSSTPIPLLCSPEWYNSPLHLFCERCTDSASGLSASINHVFASPDGEEQLAEAASQIGSQMSAEMKDKMKELLEAPYQELLGMIYNTSTPGDLGTCWMKAGQHLETLWQELQVADPVQKGMRSRFLSHCSPDTYFSVLRHCRELVEYRAATLQIVSDVALRERLVDAASHTHALCLSDPRLEDLNAGLEQLNEISTRIVRLICNWGTRYGHLFFDEEKSRRLGCKKEESLGPVFIWFGRDYLEKVYSDGLALEALYNGGSVLVKGMLASKRMTVNDTLHDGPPPLWYREKVAKEGVKMFARTKRGEGALRFSINQPRSGR